MSTSLPTSPDGIGISALDVVPTATGWRVAFAVPGDLTGPDGILQGGLAAGLAGAAVTAGTDATTGESFPAADLTTVHARLRKPTPVGALLHAEVVREGPHDFDVTIRNGDEVTVTGQVEVMGPPPVPHLPDLLELGRSRLAEAQPDHDYANCWVCGQGNIRGLRLTPHPVQGLGRDLEPWTPDERVDDGTGHAHWLAQAAVLDCPGVWAGFSRLEGAPNRADDPQRQVALLADHRVQIYRSPALGEACRAVGLVDDLTDKILRVRTAVLDEQARIISMATSLHVWAPAMPPAPTPATPLDGRA